MPETVQMWTRTTIGVVLVLVVSLVLIEAQNGKGKGNVKGKGNGKGKGNAKGNGNGKGKGKYNYDSQEYDDDLYICLKEGKKSRRCPDDKNVSPEFYDFDISVNNRVVHLHLNRNDKLRTNVPTRTLSGGGFNEKKIQDSEESVFYQDTSNGAAFVVEEDANGAKSLFGVFHVEGDRYILQTPGRNKTLDFGSNYTRFEIIKENTVNVTYDQSNLAETVPYKRPYYRYPRRKRATGSYQIELLMVVDYSIYQFWYNKSTKSTVLERETDALQKVRQFYAFVINGMDAMYKNIQTSSYTISILFAGIIIAQTSADSPWTETIVVKTVTPNQVDAETGLTNFRTWILAQSNLPGHDHAMLFTRYDMTQLGSTAITGLAYVGVLCTSYSQSIVEDRFNYVLLTVASHELGHSISAPHDGSGNACSAAGSYIMAPVSGAFFNNTNPWKFSSCSTGYFTTYINSLDTAGSNCMKSLSITYNASALAQYANEKLGQVYNANAQCVNIYGTGSFFCSGVQIYSDLSAICTLMFCYVPGTGSCSSARAADGTDCGTNKWCIAGVCTPKS